MALTKQRQEQISRVLHFKNLPYNPFRKSLYTVRELMRGYTSAHPEQSVDARIALHYNKANQKLPDVHEALAQRLHDHAIDSALYRFANPRNERPRKIVGIMGSHSTARDTSDYAKIVQTAWLLCRKGYCVVTGGGPGIMEAANLGAYLANEPENSLKDAISTLSSAPSYDQDEEKYVAVATKVRNRYADSGKSLAIPTWAYSTEPTGQFSSSIGKYFSNSIREDGLLAIAAWGVIFAPGSAGTLQEIFQDAAHNSYWSFHSRAPMVFMNKSFFTAPPSIFRVLRHRAHLDGYDKMVEILDEPADTVAFIQAHPLIRQPNQPRTFGFSAIGLKT
jgi:predicted Rossmann-fold nucleotide-binding protein